jgi:pimeloyl-ACP methyl ester carboxylesterase
VGSSDRRETTRERWARLGFDREVEVDGVRLHYVEAGGGAPVFLLHGMGDSAIGWRRQLEPLAAAGFRAIAWDMMGAGLSAKPVLRDYSIPAIAALFDEFRRALGVRRAHLLGASFGGGVALLQARHRPETIESLVLVDPACYADGVGKYVRLFRAGWFSRVVYPLVPAGLLVRLGMKQCLDDLSVLGPGVMAEIVREARRRGAKGAFARFEQCVMPEDPSEFEAGHREIRAPTLVLWGRRDRVLPMRHGERLAREILGARLVVIDSGHIPHVERPEEANRHILPFLREVGSRLAPASA